MTLALLVKLREWRSYCSGLSRVTSSTATLYPRLAAPRPPRAPGLPRAALAERGALGARRGRPPPGCHLGGLVSERGRSAYERLPRDAIVLPRARLAPTPPPPTRENRKKKKRGKCCKNTRAPSRSDPLPDQTPGCASKLVSEWKHRQKQTSWAEFIGAPVRYRRGAKTLLCTSPCFGLRGGARSAIGAVCVVLGSALRLMRTSAAAPSPSCYSRAKFRARARFWPPLPRCRATGR
jgi:hypothetical protein